MASPFVAPQFPQPTSKPAPKFPANGLVQQPTTVPPGSPKVQDAQDTASLIHDFGGFPDFPGPVTAAPHGDEGPPETPTPQRLTATPVATTSPPTCPRSPSGKAPCSPS
ncbi:hypothetical protein [Candidatus Mycobacterium methanotrophicum]|uniref:Uncharacterized protein n=1 Tax=Candidatus Mycobacterium methanotrophicum TaxID=2943498 RepID=A0ABY4QL58_9MYCO|nr:hypothetical protein [Candidatus Mycobacterium methanotrophicum]UQX11321.1 hypothetical protein M5I08_01920 [Candidatus Mycobacterium methanotrophicum]